MGRYALEKELEAAWVHPNGYSICGDTGRDDLFMLGMERDERWSVYYTEPEEKRSPLLSVRGRGVAPFSSRDTRIWISEIYSSLYQIGFVGPHALPLPRLTRVCVRIPDTKI